MLVNFFVPILDVSTDSGPIRARGRAGREPEES
jgi:hypothetical protein